MCESEVFGVSLVISPLVLCYIILVFFLQKASAVCCVCRKGRASNMKGIPEELVQCTQCFTFGMSTVAVALLNKFPSL